MSMRMIACKKLFMYLQHVHVFQDDLKEMIRVKNLIKVKNVIRVKR